MFESLRRGAWLALLLGCSEVVNPNCSDVGCFDGLSIQILENVPPGLTLRLPELSPAAWEFECTGVTCAEPIFFEEFTPEYVAVQVEVDGEIVFEGTLEPLYESVFPNGPNCEPACLRGHVRITL